MRLLYIIKRIFYRGVEKKYLVPHMRQDLFMFYTYILQSESTQKYYIGSTQNVVERLRRHNQGRGGYTKNRGPWRIKHIEEFENLSLARKRENFIKNQKSRKFIERLIAG